MRRHCVTQHGRRPATRPARYPPNPGPQHPSINLDIRQLVQQEAGPQDSTPWDPALTGMLPRQASDARPPGSHPGVLTSDADLVGLTLGLGLLVVGQLACAEGDRFFGAFVAGATPIYGFLGLGSSALSSPPIACYLLARRPTKMGPSDQIPYPPAARLNVAAISGAALTLDSRTLRRCSRVL